MGKQGIPFDPVNYTVWYEFASGQNQQLKLALDHLLEEGRKIDLRLNRDLYEQYVADEKKIILEMVRKEIRDILDNLLGSLSTFGGDLTSTEKTMDTYLMRVQETFDADAVQGIVNDIISELKSFEVSSVRMQDHLNETVMEVEKLHEKIKELRKEAKTDALTGLPNRRSFDEAVGLELENAAALGYPFSILYVDIDHFKRINDEHGHLIGDNVLKLTARMITKLIRGQDLVARYGGEEFLVILHDTDLTGGTVVAEKIRASFEKMNMYKKDGKEALGKVTLSAGVSQYRPGENIEEMIGRADKALYHSKTNGRNRVSTEQDIH
jgi:diguanylate cyclase